MRGSTRTPILSVLLEGAASTGKTAIGASLGVESEFPFVRVISADAMVGFSEASKVRLSVRPSVQQLCVVCRVFVVAE